LAAPPAAGKVADYPNMLAGTTFNAVTDPAKSRYNYIIQHG